MLLTTKQVAQKLGVRPAVVGRLVRTGKLACANADAKASADKRMHYEFDPKVIREFAATYVPIPHVVKKTLIVNVKTGEVRPGGNGHAELRDVNLPLEIPTLVALSSRLKAVETKLDTVVAKLDALRTIWS